MIELFYHSVFICVVVRILKRLLTYLLGTTLQSDIDFESALQVFFKYFSFYGRHFAAHVGFLSCPSSLVSFFHSCANFLDYSIDHCLLCLSKSNTKMTYGSLPLLKNKMRTCKSTWSIQTYPHSHPRTHALIASPYAELLVKYLAFFSKSRPWYTRMPETKVVL